MLKKINEVKSNNPKMNIFFASLMLPLDGNFWMLRQNLFLKTASLKF